MASRLRPTGETNVEGSLRQIASMIRRRSLVMLFSDLLVEPEGVSRGIHQLRHAGNDVIVFHILDAAEAQFPFAGMVEFVDKETPDKMLVDADGLKADYLAALADFQNRYRQECQRAGADYVALHTGMPFDRALIEFLMDRQKRY